jgi:hypothetical protein
MPYYDPSAVYPAWNEETAYAKGDVVSYGGYLYLAMDATEAGDNPRTAVKDFEFTKSVNNGFFGTSVADPVDVSMRLWTIFDFPVSVYYARLRGGLSHDQRPERLVLQFGQWRKPDRHRVPQDATTQRGVLGRLWYARRNDLALQHNKGRGLS